MERVHRDFSKMMYRELVPSNMIAFFRRALYMLLGNAFQGIWKSLPLKMPTTIKELQFLISGSTRKPESLQDQFNIN